MSPPAMSAIVFAVIFGGTLLGMLLRVTLPEPHLSADTKNVVRLATGLVGTIAALVLGLLIASAKASYDTQSTEVQPMTANIILLDGLLARYEDDARPARLLSRRMAPSAARVRGGTGAASGEAAPCAAGADDASFFDRLEQLSPRTEMQRSLHDRAIQIAIMMARTRLMTFGPA